jgi:hypothetical protein
MIKLAVKIMKKKKSSKCKVMLRNNLCKVKEEEIVHIVLKIVIVVEAMTVEKSHQETTL